MLTAQTKKKLVLSYLQKNLAACKKMDKLQQETVLEIARLSSERDQKVLDWNTLRIWLD